MGLVMEASRCNMINLSLENIATSAGTCWVIKIWFSLGIDDCVLGRGTIESGQYEEGKQESDHNLRSMESLGLK